MYIHNMFIYSFMFTRKRKNSENLEDANASLTDRRGMRLTCAAEKRRKRRTETKEEGGQASGESNGYSRINPSIMSSASEFPRCGERLEIIKQSGTSAAVEGGRKGGGEGGQGGRASGWRKIPRGERRPREVSALARVIVRGNKI